MATWSCQTSVWANLSALQSLEYVELIHIWRLRYKACSRLPWKVFVQIATVFFSLIIYLLYRCLRKFFFLLLLLFEGKMYSYNLPLWSILNQGIVKRDPTIFSTIKGWVTSLLVTRIWKITIKNIFMPLRPQFRTTNKVERPSYDTILTAPLLIHWCFNQAHAVEFVNTLFAMPINST